MPIPPQHSLKILAVDPWLGGSHEAFLSSWRERSAHEVDVAGLADCQWKWRMRAGAWELARSLRDREAPELLLVSDFLDLPAFLGFLPAHWREVPCVLYMHENQLTYPLRDGIPESERDTSYGFTNILSCVRADVVVFNSCFHRDEFAGAAEAFLRRLPKPTPAAELRRTLASARIIAPGVDLGRIPLGAGGAPGSPLRILFNHRWQFDKDPLAFLNAARGLQELGLPFELVLLGERFLCAPDGTDEALALLEAHITRQGYIPSREEYVELLGACDLTVSTARHEFFGISTVEAMGAGVTPLLPDRLSYPEVVGVDPGGPVLYNGTDELLEKLVSHGRSPDALRETRVRQTQRRVAMRWSDEVTAQTLDALCLDLVERRRVKT